MWRRACSAISSPAQRDPRQPPRERPARPGPLLLPLRTAGPRRAIDTIDDSGARRTRAGSRHRQPPRPRPRTNRRESVILSAGNFHGMPVALPLDTITIAASPTSPASPSAASITSSPPSTREPRPHRSSSRPRRAALGTDDHPVHRRGERQRTRPPRQPRQRHQHLHLRRHGGLQLLRPRARARHDARAPSNARRSSPSNCSSPREQARRARPPPHHRPRASPSALEHISARPSGRPTLPTAPRRRTSPPLKTSSTAAFSPLHPRRLNNQRKTAPPGLLQTYHARQPRTEPP